MGCIESTCCDEADNHDMTNKPIIRMCAPGKDSINFADHGDKIVLYVDFGNCAQCSPCPLQYDTVERGSPLERVRATVSSFSYQGQQRYEKEIMIAGQITELIQLHPAASCSKTYKAIMRIPFGQDDIGFDEGGIIPVKLPYLTQDNQYAEMTQEDIKPQHAVFFQPIWNQLKEHNKDRYIKTLSHRSSSLGYGGRYGSLAGRSGIDSADGTSSIEQEENLIERQRRERQKPQRYWPDSWQMNFWKHCCCESIMRSKNCCTRFIAMFFVAPLVNVTGLSLHYQLYMSEIFHTRFWTRLFHYLLMPFIVLMMLIFFAQWRFVFDNDASNCYRNNNFEVLVINGALLLAIIFFIWYLICGILHRNLMGIFMVVPLIILVILANIYFQLSIKNSLPKNYPCHVCWNHTIHATGMVQYYNLFDQKLMHWYYNPVLWAGVLSFFQSLSHIFEPKIPPRVTQTPHWMSIPHMCKRMGFTKSICILTAQLLFGVIDEFCASPRLLPIFVLRVCYDLGYQRREWKWMKKLVKHCLAYGDPAIDFIGIGGAEHPSFSSSILNKDKVSIDELKKEVRSMEHALSPQHKKILQDPALMKEFKNQQKNDPFLTHYVTLRHYVAQYSLQVYAYGPFRDNHSDDRPHVHVDNARRSRDFGHSPSFLRFLDQVRLSLWEMEDDLLDRIHCSSCCRPQVEEV